MTWIFYWNWTWFSHSVWWVQIKMLSGVNFYHTSEIGEERSVVIKKKQVNLAQVALVFKVMINIIHITCIFKIFL